MLRFTIETYWSALRLCTWHHHHHHPSAPRSRCHLALVQTAEQMTSQTSGLVFDMCDMHDYDHMYINKYACTNPFEYMKNCKNLEINSKLLLTYESSDNRDHIYITLNAFGQLVMQLACDKNVTAKVLLNLPKLTSITYVTEKLIMTGF